MPRKLELRERDNLVAHKGLVVVWSETMANGEETVIVEDATSGRRYLWPALTAWRQPLPGETNRKVLEPLSANVAAEAAKPRQLTLF